MAPGQSPTRLQDLDLVSAGLTTGTYRLQVRLQQDDEIAGSTVRYADIRFAQTGVDVSGLPAHSPLLGSSSERLPQQTNPLNAVDLGNLASSDRGSFSLAGEFPTAADEVDFYQFSIDRTLTQSGGQHISATFDIDYASDFGRPNTSLWVYQKVTGGYRLVLTGSDSNIADDRARPGQLLGDADDLSRGSSGSKDAYIGSQELPDGDYIVAVSSNSRLAVEYRQFQEANPAFPLVRVEPIDSIQRIVTDRFEAPLANQAETFLAPKQVAFNGPNLASTNSVPFTLADVSTFVVQDINTGSRLLFANAMTGAKEAEGVQIARVNDVAMSSDGRLVAYTIPTTGTTNTDAVNGNFVLIDPSANGATTALGNSGIQTFTTEQTAAGPPPTFAIRQRTRNNAQVGDGMQFHALTFYTNANATQPTAADLRLFGVGRRSPGSENFTRANVAADGTVSVNRLVDDEPTNIIYRLDPLTGAAIQPAIAALVTARTNNRTLGAGTDIVEFGTFVTADRASIVTGVTDLGNRLVAVSDAGELFVSGNVGDGTNPFGNVNPRTTIIDTTTGQPVAFSGLATGPTNLASGFSTILFGTTAAGVIYAFNEFGVLQNVFPGGNFKISASGTDSLTAAPGGSIKGIDFSPLDVNLWHQTNAQNNVAGHGRNATFDLSRQTTQAGTNSLYFGFENSGNDATTNRQPGSWDPVHSVFDGGYNLPGGAHGAIESQPVDLRGYSAEDLPTLYFTYYLDSENANSDSQDNNVRMKDALRVYIAGDDGRWIQVVTNNSAKNGNLSNARDEFDANISNYADANGLPLMVQEAYDVADNGAPDSWRQARVDLAPFAGQKNVKIRYEFSTGATFRTGDPERGGVELNAVEGSRLADGNFFTVVADSDIGGGTRTFEFDMGLVLNLPGGSGIVPGSQLNMNGTAFTFSTTTNGPTDIFYSLTSTPAQIATAVRNKLAAAGFTVVTNSDRSNTINVTSAPVGTYSVTGLPAATIEGQPGVSTGAVSVPVDQSMTTTQVRDAMRTALARAFNVSGQNTNTSVWPVYGQSTIRMFKYTVTNAGPLSTAARSGDGFGVQLTGTAPNGGGAYSTMFERAQNNAGNVGVFIDDIVIGLAERGEMVTNTTASTGAAANLFTANLHYEQAGLGVGGSTPNEIELGKYQLEIRTSAEYGLQDNANLDLDGAPFRPSRSFDSNDRLAQQIGIQVNGSIADGSTFTLSDGVELVTFEFDVTNTAGDIAAGTAAGNIAIAINANDTTAQIANKIRDAINRSTVQSLLKVSASVNGELNSTSTTSGSNLVLLHGPAALTRAGGLTFSGITGLSIRRWGTESTFGEDLGDTNRLRDQGLVVIASSTISDSQNFGINVDAAPLTPIVAPSTGISPTFPGAPVNFPTDNADRLAPGVVIFNNILAKNRAGGLAISGEATTQVQRPATIARVLNNTIYGTRSGDVGIRVNEDAAPLILNNVIANTGTAITEAGANPNRVIGGTLYFDNASQNILTGESVRLVSTTSPFVNAASGFFYPSANSLAIDSSLEVSEELGSLTQIKDALNLPLSPAIAPDRDFTGQRRVDDFNVAPPGGVGANAFKDRGAVERADVTNLTAVLLQPQDNDSANVDADRNSTYIRLTEGRLDFFSILLNDGDGAGPDQTTVQANRVTVTENGRLLQPGVDFVFGYNANSRTIRLTPLSGIWRIDSVYEITLNNQRSFDLSVGDGNTVVDGSRFTVTHAGGTTVFEMDRNGAAATTGARLVPFTTGMTNYEIALQLRTAINNAGIGVTAVTKGAGTISVLSATNVVAAGGAGVSVVNLPAIADLAGNPLFANRSNSLTQFTIVMPEADFDFGDAQGAAIPVFLAPNSAVAPVVTNGNGARHVLLPVDVPQLALGSLADADADGQPNAAADGDDTDGSAQVALETLGSVGGLQIGVAGPAVLSFPAGAGLSGQTFTITDSANRPFAPVTFEFATSAVAGSVVIPVVAGDTASDVAIKVAAAVNSAVISGRLTGLTPVANAAQVSLGGSASDVINLANAPGVSRLPAGNVQIIVPTSIAALADGQTLTIQDPAGRSVTFELNNTDPAVTATPVTAGRVAINVDLATATAADVASALGAAVDSQVAARRLSLGTAIVNGSSVSIIADDEDGVSFGGVFNAGSNPVSVTVVSTGAGLLDAWIDWNRDGDFSDSGERLFSTSQPVVAGTNVFQIQTPVTASVGFTNARFRVSTLGGLLPLGVGIGGEVEDHLIEIAAGAPPVVQSDSYTTDEDLPGGLTVPRLPAVAGGPQSILANDTDADIVTPAVIDPGVNLFVHDQNPATADIDPVTEPANGTLTLNRDGSFTYIPDPEFSGTDTFVYNATDGRLISRIPTTVTIIVNPVNDPPLAVDDVRTTTEDQAYVRLGSEFTANDHPHFSRNFTEAGQVLTLDSATIVTHTISDLGGVAGLRVRIASQPGQGNYGIRVYATAADLGAGVLPTVTVGADRIDVVLNSNVGSPSTVNQFIAAINGNAAAAALVVATLDSGDGTTVIGTAPTAYSPLQVPPRAFSSFSVANNTLSYTPAPQYNNSIGGPVLIAITIRDDGAAGPPAGLTATSTLTLNIAEVNDSPEFSMPATETKLEDAGFVTVPNFLTNRRPGPVLAADEGSGPAVTPSNQTVTYRVTALNPSLFHPGDAAATPPVPNGLPRIDANGTLTYRLANDVNRVTPFPAVLVEVVAVDSVTPSTLVATNAFDITQIFPAAGKSNSYDGTTLRITDTAGNAVTFELEDAVNLPGVRNTGAVPNRPILIEAADTAATINQKIADAINAVTVTGPNPWAARAYVDTASNEIRFVGVASAVATRAAKVHVLDNLFPAVVAGTSSFDGATFTITDTSGDAIVFEFNDTTNAAPATAGVTAGRVAINYTPTTTQAQLSTAIDAAIKAPPAAILTGLAGSWEVTSVLSGNRLQLTNVRSIALSASTAAITNPLASLELTPVNPLAVRPTNESIPRTFTITPTEVNDAPEFSLPADTRSEEDQGVIVIPNFVTGIRKGPVTALDEVVQVFDPVRIDANPAAFTTTGYPTIDNVTGELRYETARNFNAPLGIPVDVTFIDQSGTANGGVDRTKKTFTLFVTERNDSPEFNMPTQISAFQEVPDPIGLTTTVDPFITNIMSGPGTAGDESSQTITFVATALKPSLFFPGDAAATPPVPDGLPRIDANGRLTYRLAVDVNQIVPFPTILVQVIASDNGTIGNGQVVTNRFNPAYVSPSVPNIYDGATLNVVDTNGNRVIFELNDVGLPGVGTTGGFPHVAINFDATDTAATINQKIITAVGAPPTASINLGTTGPWVARAFVDAATQEIKFTSATSVVANTPAPRIILENLFPTVAAGASYDGATFTITDIDGDSITFEFNDTTNTAPATAGVGLGHVAIDYTPTTTKDQLTQAIRTAISTPPAPLAATWNVTTVLPTGSHRLQLSGAVNITRSAAANAIVGVERLDPVFAVRESNTSAPRTFTILPDAINDPPEYTIRPTLLAASYPEDNAAVTITDFIIDARPGPLTALDELLSQRVRVHSITSAAGAFETLTATVDPVTGKGNLTFKTNKDVNSASHDLTVVVTLKDGDEATDSTVQFTSKTFTITVDPINDLPEFNIPVTQVTRLEDVDAVSIPGFATNILAGPATAIDETTHPATRQTFNFVLVSNSNDSIFEELPTITPAGELRFKSKPHQNGSSVVVVRLVDDGTVPARTPTDSQQSIADQTFTITLDAINDAPTFRIARPAVSLEDAGVVVIPGFLADVLPGPVEATDEASQSLTITATPVDPSVFTLFSLSANGTLSYQTKPDLNNLNANFSVQVFVTDNGVAGPAPNTNRSATQMFTIDVTPVNDEPTFQLLRPQVDVIEDAQNAGLPPGATVVPGFAFNYQRGPATATDEFTQVLNPFEIISVSAPEKFSVLPAIDLATGNLSFTTAEHKNGKAVVIVRITDQGASSPAPNDNASALHTFTISIEPINDRPQFTIDAEKTVDEDAGLISHNGFASGVRRGPVGSDDENSQLISFEVRAVNPALFAVQPAIGVDGTLTFQTANNVNSANSPILVEVTLVDNGLNTPAPNVNRSTTQTFTIVVNPVNDPPTTDVFTATVVEDGSTVIQASDVLVGDVAGPTADELGQTLRISQVQRTSLNGGRITPVIDPLDPTRIISFTYEAPSNLVGNDTFLYVVTDNGSPERSGTGTITMSVSAINDPPRFNRGPDQALTEDSPAVTVANWATDIFAGPASAADELASQTVSFTVVASKPELFAVQPQVSSNGTLTYTLAKDAIGTTSVTITAVDSGSGTAPNVNTSAAQTFTIDIAPINDAPVFTAGGNVTVVEDSGAYSRPWATAIAPAAGLLAAPATAVDEAAQLVEFEVIVDQPALFSVQPKINSSGLLEFTPVADASGAVRVIVTAVDRGPAGVLDTPRSVPQTFTINITPSNDAPIAVDDGYATNEDTSLSVPARGLLLNDTDVDLPLDTLAVVAGNFTSDLGASVTVNANGSFVYDPRTVASFQQLTAGQTISDTFVYRIVDTAGALSIPATVTVAINGVDDPPLAVNDRYSIGVGSSRNLDVLTNDTDVDSTIDPRTIVIKANPGFGTVTVNQTGVITYTPEGGFRGNDSFRYTVKDATGNESNEALVELTINSAPTASNDSAFTYKGVPVQINVLGNDQDLDGTLDPSTVRIEAAPGVSGTAEVLPSGAIRFTPAAGFSGDAQFFYSVQDNSGTPSNVARVSVRVANSRWQNPQGTLDVNADNFVSPIDALLIINYLNSGAERFLPSSGIDPAPFLDPTGDELVSPLDVLSVINFLNENSQGGQGGEGEATQGASLAYAMMVTPQQMIDTVGKQVVEEIQSIISQTLSENGSDHFLGASGFELTAEGEGEADDDVARPTQFGSQPAGRVDR